MHIRELAGDSKEAFERAVLLNRLPDPVRNILANSGAPNNDALAKEASRVMEAFLLARSGAGAGINAVASPSSSSDAVEVSSEVNAVSSKKQGPSTATSGCGKRQGRSSIATAVSTAQSSAISIFDHNS